MKGTRKKHDSKFKVKAALEAIKEHETLNELAVKYEVSPVMISRWKKEFIENSSVAFEAPKVDDTVLEKEKDRYLRVIGDLQMQLDFAKRVSKKLGIERDTRKELVSPEHNLSLSKQCAILGLNRTSIYYTPKGESKENLEMMQSIWIIQPRG